MNRFNYIGMLAYVALSMSSCDDGRLHWMLYNVLSIIQRDATLYTK